MWWQYIVATALVFFPLGVEFERWRLRRIARLKQRDRLRQLAERREGFPRW